MNIETIDKEKLIEFALRSNPNLLNEFEIYNMKPEDLIGKTVWSNRAGFSCGGEGGTEMRVDSFDPVNKYISFKPTPNSEYLGATGWSCHIDELYYKIRLTEKRKN